MNKTKKQKSKKQAAKYLEAGLAVFIVCALALAGQAGFLEETRAGARKTAAALAGTENAEALGKEAAKENERAGTGEEKPKEADPEEACPILGDSEVTVQQMVDYFHSSGKEYPEKELAEGGADSIEVFCRMYYDEAGAEGVRAEVAFAQTMKETGFLQYGGDASIEQFNFAGIGTTGNGVPGNSYPDVRTGIRAQIQHLKAYATADALEQECVDDRYSYVKKGSAPYVEWLGQQENPEGVGWATGDNYGYDIVGMIEDMTE